MKPTPFAKPGTNSSGGGGPPPQSVPNAQQEKMFQDMMQKIMDDAKKPPQQDYGIMKMTAGPVFGVISYYIFTSLGIFTPAEEGAPPPEPNLYMQNVLMWGSIIVTGIMVIVACYAMYWMHKEFKQMQKDAQEMKEVWKKYPHLRPPPIEGDLQNLGTDKLSIANSLDITELSFFEYLAHTSQTPMMERLNTINKISEETEKLEKQLEEKKFKYDLPKRNWKESDKRK